MPQVTLDRRQDGDGSAAPGSGRGRHRGSHRARRRPASGRPARRRPLALLALTGTLAGGGLAAVGLLAAGSGQFSQTGAVVLRPAAVASISGAGRQEGAGSAIPTAGQPRSVTIPGPSASVRARKKPTRSVTSPSPSATPSVTSASPTTTASPTASPPAPSRSASPAPTASATAAPTAPAGDASCGNPVFTTSGSYGTYTSLPYYVANNMWNAGGANATQTISVCSPSNWYVTAAMDNGNGGVKTYPNVHRDFDSPAISSLKTVTSSFAETSPGTGTYEDAYDIWLNAVANASEGSDEVMIWNDNHGQIPGGSPQGTVTFGGRSYTVWKGAGNYVAFVADSTFTSGTLDLLDFFQYLIGKGWVPASSTLVEVCYGAEVVNTNGAQERFSFGGFSVDAS